jgi:hypothetical protein
LGYTLGILLHFGVKGVPGAWLCYFSDLGEQLVLEQEVEIEVSTRQEGLLLELHHFAPIICVLVVLHLLIKRLSNFS